MATVVVDGGLAIITNRLISAGTEPKYSSCGTGAGVAAVGDTSLSTENVTSFTGDTRVTGTSSRVTTAKANDTYQVVATHTADAGVTVTQAGLFDAVSAGNLFAKGDFTGVALASGDSLQITYKVQFA